jgi:maltose alpha-D-glucosyltransferase / alpha-amylase
VLYYGDEIGLGENIYLGDRNGVRTPMQWSSDKNAGFSRANPQSLYLPIILDPAYHYEACNVEEQLANPHSLLWWMRRMLALRKRWRALGEGKCEFLQPENHKILAYILRHENETLLVVANLSRFTQPVNLDLSTFNGMVPIELFGRMKFPVISETPYFFTLGPHNFYWFSLETRTQLLPAKTEDGVPVALPSITVMENWREIITGKARAKFEALLPDYFRSRPWFASKTKTIKFVTLKEHFTVPLADSESAELVFLQVEYVDANPEIYALPLGLSNGNGHHRRWHAHGIVELTLQDGGHCGLVYDALASPAFAKALLHLIREREHVRNEHGEIEASRTTAMRQLLNADPPPDPIVHDTHEGNTTALFPDRIVLKFFRRLGQGVNPELEIGRFLSEKEFPHSPRLLGALEYHGDDKEQIMTLAVAKSFVPYAKNAWKFTLDAVTRYYDRVFADAVQGQNLTAPPTPGPLKLLHQDQPLETADRVGTYLESARLLGVRTAELHLALASGDEAEDFSQERVTTQYLRGVFQSMRSLAVQNLRLLRKQIKTLPPDLVPVAQRVIELEPVILQHYRQLVDQRFEAGRIRIHGNFHLGQVLWTGRDFVFLDFEGDPLVAISERRIKRSPLRDVARMLRSFHHAAYAGFHQQVDLGVISRENLPKFEPWVRHWNRTVSYAFLQAYCQKLHPSGILPDAEDKLWMLLLAYLMNQVIDELGCELRNHSDNVRAPLHAIIIFTDEHLAATSPPVTGKKNPDKHA